MTASQMQDVLLSTISEFQLEENGSLPADSIISPGNLLINAANQYVYIGDKLRCSAFISPDDISCDLDIKEVLVSKLNKVFFTDNNKLTLYRHDGNDVVLVRTVDKTYSDTDDIPIKITRLSTHSFKDSNLTSFSIPPNQSFIPEECFASSNNLKNIDITQHIDKIESGAFKDCMNIKSVSLKSCNEICDQAFLKCSKLENIELPSDLSSLGKSAFKQCTQLSCINLENTSVSCIQQGTFNECSSLQCLTFPKTVQSIEERSFIGCKSLSALVFKDFDNCVNTKVCFDAGLPKDFKIVVPDKLYDEWIEQEYECNADNVIEYSKFHVL